MIYGIGSVLFASVRCKLIVRFISLNAIQTGASHVHKSVCLSVCHTPVLCQNG